MCHLDNLGGLGNLAPLAPCGASVMVSWHMWLEPSGASCAGGANGARVPDHRYYCYLAGHALLLLMI